MRPKASPSEDQKSAAANSAAGLSTRLFPRGEGCDAYHITGLAARCDWVLLSDWKAPQIALRRNRETDQPRHIFLSLRAPFPALLHFAKDILPGLRSPFVLVSGSEDITLPRQTDQRWRRYNDAERAAIAAILASPLLVKWFAENLDDASQPKLTPLPLGLVFPDGGADAPLQLPQVLPLSARPLRVLCAHRVREGAQWEARRTVSALAQGPWRDWCTVPEEDVTEAAFTELLQSHAFVLCVQGGGLDPSPKAWAALIHGAVPLIHCPSLMEAYGQLPVVPLPGWQADSITFEKLKVWRRQMIPRMDSPAARQALHSQLCLDHWWQKIAAAVPA